MKINLVMADLQEAESSSFSSVNGHLTSTKYTGLVIVKPYCRIHAQGAEWTRY